MRGRLFSPRHPSSSSSSAAAALSSKGGLLPSSSSSSSSSRGNRFAMHLRSKDTLLTLSLFALSMVLFALPNFLLSEDASMESGSNANAVEPKAMAHMAPQHERDSEGRTRPSTPRRVFSSPSGSSSRKSGSNSGSSGGSSSNEQQRASDGGIYRRMYNLTEPELDETIKGTVLDVKVTLDSAQRVDIGQEFYHWITPTRRVHPRNPTLRNFDSKRYRKVFSERFRCD